MPTNTTKKATTRKQPKKASVKRATAKPVNKTIVRTKKIDASTVRSFHASAPEVPFFTFRISHQTFYWLILAVIVVGLAAWVLSISIQVQHIYDQIDATNQTMLSMPAVSGHKR